MVIFLDIETICCQRDSLIAELRAAIKPPATHKKPETIAKWELEDKPAVGDAIIRNTSFDGTYGMVCMVGIAIEDGPVEVLCNKVALAAQEWTIAERDCLLKLDKYLAEALNALTGPETGRIQFVGHNILSFDLRFLWQRYVINGIKAPRIIPFATRWSGERVYDTMLEWHPDRDRRISLDRLCKALVIPTPKGDMDGSAVWPRLQEGRVHEVVAYCANDIEALRAVHKRMTFA